ncbi:MAG: IS110 family transposase [Betaproteobacteria bacterium]|nr:IS110 family transposase [Betaproteobacteria bacterium]
MTTIIGAGIDVAKDTLQAYWAHGNEQEVSNDVSGWDALVAAFRQAGVAVVGMEATGGYERKAAYALQAAGFAVMVLNATQARRFAQAMNYMAKTDRIDAKGWRSLPASWRNRLRGSATSRRRPMPRAKPWCSW